MISSKPEPQGWEEEFDKKFKKSRHVIIGNKFLQKGYEYKLEERAVKAFIRKLLMESNKNAYIAGSNACHKSREINQ